MNAAERFAAFDAKNPHIWRLFERFTFELIASGFKHHSAHAIIFRIRWETDVQTVGAGFAEGRQLKISNGVFPFYSRKFARLHPEHKGFFRFRHSQADDLPTTQPAIA